MGPKQALYAEFAQIARALGSPHRLELLEHVAQGERGVDALAARSALSLANASQHLQHLKRAGLVVARRDGKAVLYSLANDRVLDLMHALFRVGEQNLAQVSEILRRYFLSRDSLAPVTREDLESRVREGLVTVLDVRPPDEYAAGHLRGAVNIPLADLQARLGELDPAQKIVAYCRGPYCVLSFEAVATLRAHGLAARRLEDGFPEWKAMGLPVSLFV